MAALLTPAIIGAQRVEAECTPEPVAGVVIDKTAHLSLERRSLLEDGEPDARQLERLRLVLQGIQRSFEAPPPIAIRPSLSVVLNGDDHEPFHSASVDAKIAFTAHADGRVSGLRVDRPSVAPAIDSSVVRAIARAADDWHIGALAVATSTDVRPIGADSTTILLRVSTEPDSATITFPLAMLSVDAYVVQMAMLAPNNLPPPYPEHLRQQWVEGAVLLEFIVGTDGRADMRTVRVIETSSLAFTQAVRAHLPSMKYYPASIGGCLVRMEVKQPFTFRIGR